MAQMTGGQAIVRSLIGHGVDTVFGIPGVQVDALFNAFYDERNAIRVIHTRHEQGAAYMAFGYAAATGKVGTCAVVPGPGLLNTTAALSTAYACNTPVLCLSGQIPSRLIGRGVGVLHEIPDQLALIRGLTKWAARADEPGDAPGLIVEAFKQLSSGRRRPVEIEMSMDVMAREAEVALLDPVDADAPPAPDLDKVEDAARLLGNARNPMIFAGGGISGAEAELLALAEMLQAPVIMSRPALGAISDRHYLAQNTITAHRLWKDADVVLGVGTRLSPMVPQWGVDDGLKIVRIDIDPEEIDRAGKTDIAIVADSRDGLAALIERTGGHNIARPSREDELTAVKAAMRRELDEKFGPQTAYLGAIRETLSDDGVFVEELTQPGYVARFALPIYQPRTFITTGYQGTLGFGFATALGVKVARPDVPVVSICGDGGFMYNVQELATAVQQNIGLVTVVFSDGHFGNVRRMQVEDYGGKVIATKLHNPDFVKLAESFGARGLRAETPAALRDALELGFKSAGPTLIDVPVGDMPSPWDYLQPQAAR